MTRAQAREEAFRLLFETEFKQSEDPAAIYAAAMEDREFTDNDYIKTVYFGVSEKLEELDAIITKHSTGWKASRLTPVSRSICRLCLYEMLYCTDIPHAVSLNEAVELVKKFEDPKMRSFVNGLLNHAKNEIEADKSNA